MKFNYDNSGVLKKYVDICIEKYRNDIKDLNFLCAWRNKEKWEDGELVLAEVQKLPPKYRDTLGYDVALIVDANAWKNLKKQEKRKLIFHELEHVQLEYDKTEVTSKTVQEMFEAILDDDVQGLPKYDSDDRIKIQIRDHNLVIKKFSKELLKFGLSEKDEAIRQFLNYVYKNKGLNF